jgi:hypothetical protein
VSNVEGLPSRECPIESDQYPVANPDTCGSGGNRHGQVEKGHDQEKGYEQREFFHGITPFIVSVTSIG